LGLSCALCVLQKPNQVTKTKSAKHKVAKNRVRKIRFAKNRITKDKAVKKSIIDTESWLATTEIELKRLQNHPELYPSISAEQDFLRDVYNVCDIMLEKWFPTQETLDRLWEDYFKTLEDLAGSVAIPNFDKERTLWQQFLHNRAPGSGADRSLVARGCSAQIIPSAGVRLIFDLLNKRKMFIREIQAVGTACCYTTGSTLANCQYSCACCALVRIPQHQRR